MSKSILEKNLEAMEKWYPAFADLIREEHETEDPTNVMVETSWDGETIFRIEQDGRQLYFCLLYTSPSPRAGLLSRMPSSA